MALYKSSTKKEPLLFFSSFLEKDVISRYENNFYDNPVNLSQTYDKDQGYIQYHKDFYEEGETPTVKIYFKDYLRKHLATQSIISENFLIEREKTLEFEGGVENRFVHKQLDLLGALIKKSNKLPYKDLINDVLNDLNLKITSLINPETAEKLNAGHNPPNDSFNGFFGNNKYSKRSHLIKLYDGLSYINVIDEDIVTEENFINVLTTPNPDKIDDRIQFSVNNYGATIFIMELAKYFDDLTFAKIGRSKLFIPKGGKGFLSASSLYRSKSEMELLHHKKFENIHKAIKKALPKLK